MRHACFAAGLLAVLSGWSGCRSGPPPEDLYREAETLRLKYEKSSNEQAIAKYQAAAAAWTRLKEMRQVARATQRVGASYAQLGLLQPSLQAYQAALAAAKDAADPALESEALSDVGTALSLVAVRERDFDEARRHCEAALAMARLGQAVREEARALTCLGEAAYNRGERERALENYLEAGALSARAGDTRGEAEALLNQGTVFSDESEFGRAGTCLERARQLWASLGDARGTAMTLVAISKLQLRRGEYQDALNGLHEALGLLQTMGDVVWEGVSLTSLGSVYLHMGDAASALDYWERARVCFQTAGLNNFSVDLLMSLGDAYLASGDDASALERFERALALGTELGDDHWQAYALRFIGVVHLTRGHAAEAVTYFERSLAVQERIRDPRFQAQTRADLGEAWRLHGEPSRARASFDAAVSLSRTAEDRLGEARGLDGLARVSMSLGDLDTALGQIERSVALAESLRAEVEGRDLRASYFASVRRYHETHVDVLMRLHRSRPGRGYAAAAFDASERARARSLLDGLAEAGVDLRKGVDPALLRREDGMRQAFASWAARQRQALDDGAAPDLARQFAREYRDLEIGYNALDAEIRSRSPRYAALAKPRPLTLAQVQQSIVDRDTMLLVFALGETRSYLWAVSNDRYRVHELPPGAEIGQVAQQVYARATARLALTGTPAERKRMAEENDFLFGEQAAHLSDVLFGPVAGDL
ncbi:MAG: tetratricopeptide repeat protein, partial [Rhodospirillaceae bacterium]